MKKAFVLFIGLIICGIGAFCLLPWYVMQEADQLVFTENVIYGDPSAAEGVTITSHSHYNDYLFWDTVYTAGKNPVAQTEYRFYTEKEEKKPEAGGQNSRIRGSIDFYGRLPGDVEYIGYNDVEYIDYGGDFDDAYIENEELKAACKQLVEETKAGQTQERTIVIKDDSVCYTFDIELFLRGSMIDALTLTEQIEMEKKLAEQLEIAYKNFFRIPVVNATYHITVAKDVEGNKTEVYTEFCGDRFEWNVKNIFTETDLYFIFSPYSESGKQVDTGLIPGGYGIYRQPYSFRVVDGEAVIAADASQLKMVYPLEEELYADIYMSSNAAGQLVILTDEETASYLQVIDPDSMELIQKIELPRPEGTDGVSIVRDTEEFMLLYCGNYYFTLLDWNEERGYEEQFVIRVESGDLLVDDYHNLPEQDDMEWNGERLYYACILNNYGWDAHGDFQLAVYDKNGLIYRGDYISSLRTEQEVNRGMCNDDCLLRRDVPIDVECN